jgi:carbon starvation protein CstA
MIVGAVIGVFVANPACNLKPFTSFNVNGQYMFPILFVTIACGAVSGFHSLVSSGTASKQIKNEMLEPVLRYGILKERMSALITDAVRADLLESKGYDTQILEFIDMEHTPKNLLIRAVRTGKRSDQGKVEKMLAALNIHPTLDRLLNEKEQEGSVR